MTHLSITKAGLTALATTIIGQLVAFVPALAADKQQLISTASVVISASFLLANAVHALIASKASATDIEKGVGDLVKAELGRVDLNALVGDALKGENVSQIVQGELRRLLGSAVTPPPAPAPVAPLVPVPPAA